MKYLAVISTIVALITPASAISAKAIEDLGLETSAGVSRVLPTNVFLRSTNDNAISINADIRAGFRFNPTTRYGRMYPNVRQGVGLSFMTFAPNSSFGTPFGIYIFQSVNLYHTGRWHFEAGWSFGVTAPWRHFDPDEAPANTAIGSKVNASLGINAATVLRLSPKWSLRAAITADHYSNGNTTLPNSGINSIGLEIGSIYTIDGTNSTSDTNTRPAETDFSPGMSYDLTVFGATRRHTAHDTAESPVAIPGKFGVAGLSFAPMYDINRYFRAGAAIDMQYDESANIDRHLVDGTYGDNVKFYRQPFSERMSVGLSLRAELTLAMFGINFGFGRNIIARGESRAIYQTLALKAYVVKGAYINIGYRISDFHRPENLMLGVGYSFGR